MPDNTDTYLQPKHRHGRKSKNTWHRRRCSSPPPSKRIGNHVLKARNWAVPQLFNRVVKREQIRCYLKHGVDHEKEEDECIEEEEEDENEEEEAYAIYESSGDERVIDSDWSDWIDSDDELEWISDSDGDEEFPEFVRRVSETTRKRIDESTRKHQRPMRYHYEHEFDGDLSDSDYELGEWERQLLHGLYRNVLVFGYTGNTMVVNMRN
jgi:hypothetical protein